ncbi:MAG: AAA family ATPase [Succinivibrio sp.]|nr:AAA family ATPase [Succinivibrio sp.]
MKEISQADGIEDFADNDYIYVDKTEYIYKLVKKYKRVFFSRPRRFGKTLTLNIIGTLYEEGVEPYFKGTWIYDKWTFGQFPVLRLNFQNYRAQSVSEFKELCSKAIIGFANEQELNGLVTSTEPDVAVLELLNALKHKKQRIVILIDEYDYQMTANINNRELYEEFRLCIRNFYSNLKSNKQIKFMAVTGVTRLKDVSIFSAGSDIKDLTYESAFSQMIGFTREEIKRFYRDYLKLGVCYEQNKQIKPEDVTEKQVEEFLDRMAYHYDGYCFDELCKDKVFSTWSVNNFLQALSNNHEVIFGDYWYDVGGVPSILANYLEKHTLDVAVLQQEEILISYNDFKNPTSLTSINQSVLMCQTGYLTLRSSLAPGRFNIRLGIANRETESALSALLSLKIFDKTQDLLDQNDQNILEYCDASQLISILNEQLASVVYDKYPIKDESTLRSVLQLYLQGSRVDVRAESHNAHGSADLILNFKRRRIVLELKFSQDGRNAQSLLNQALKQIDENDYGRESLGGRELLRIAAVFSAAKDERKITLWQEVAETK